MKTGVGGGENEMRLKLFALKEYQNNKYPTGPTIYLGNINSISFPVAITSVLIFFILVFSQ